MVDWNDATFRTGFNQDYNASISGATERVNYYFSLGYINNEGAVQGNEYNAFRSNMKINAKITDWLEVGANVNFQDRSDGDIQVSLGSNYWDNNMLRNSPYASMYDNNGNYEQYPMSGLPTNGGYNYYFDRQYYDWKGVYRIKYYFNAKLLCQQVFLINSILLLVISGSMTVIGCLLICLMHLLLIEV